VEFQVQNGECYDSDTMLIRFYEQPEAKAGVDSAFCNTFSFSLWATPYVYCGAPDENYWSDHYWTTVNPCREIPTNASIDPVGPDGVVSITDPSSPNATVTITGGLCPFGQYTFYWVERNSKGPNMGGCQACDDVTVTIFEDPAPNAGIDESYCETEISQGDGFYFCLDGTLDAPCYTETAVSFTWEVVTQPDDCSVSFAYTPGKGPLPDPDMCVSITNCNGCPYGQYTFRLTQKNGYTDQDGFHMVCETSDDVSVWIYEQPVDVFAGDDQELCNNFAFTLTAVGYDYCGDDALILTNSYSWTLVSQPGNPGCPVTITNGTELIASVTIDPCQTSCMYGEYVFRFTEYNGNDSVWCEDDDLVSVFIYEDPVADAGGDVHACVDGAYSPYCYSMYGTLEYCYTMYGKWTKTCGPGDVVFEDLNDPTSDVCFPTPGRYEFEWIVWNTKCADTAQVQFDLLETPMADGGGEFNAVCDELCYSLNGIITKYDYHGTINGAVNTTEDCPNYWDMAHWFYVSGPASDVTFAPDATNVDAELCVTIYGGYTVGWVELNKPDDKDYYCSDTALVYVAFYETPVPDAGDDIAFCGNCYTLVGIPYEYQPTSIPPDDYYWWTDAYGTFLSDEAEYQVCITEYGTYKYYFWESNGDCIAKDSVSITFHEIPVPIPLCYVNANDCVPFGQYPIDRDLAFGCLQPNDTISVCADDCTNFDVTCQCPGFFDWSDPNHFGWTFEWSVVAPSGTTVNSVPGYYDFNDGHWIFPTLDICWGECCDYARIYLTITTPDCELTIVYYVYVTHKPCANIEGPDVSDVGTVTEYCNVCPPEFDQSCLLYNWTAEHCGTIESGQGTECIEVLWTDYNINGGWGEITLTVFDTCTGCCNYDEMPVKIWPAGTLGDATLSGYVYYHNIYNTPLNGVTIQLWNGTIPVMSSESFNEVAIGDDPGHGMGYYEFTGINGVTDFGITASYDAPWYGNNPSGVNATDALAVQLKVIDSFPLLFDAVVGDAMDVNNSNTISATDALWIKQRAIGMVTYFPAGDWAFDPDMSSTAGTYDIYTLNTGDANRSIIPNSMKAAPAIDLVTDGTMNVVTGQVFDLPIRIKDASQFGAITLDLSYDPALIEVVDVAPVDGMISNITTGNVSIAYTSVNPMILAENQVVVTLKVKAISPFTSAESMFTIGVNSEFADGTAKVVEPVTLKSFGVTTAPAATDYFLSANRPNPFNNSTFIEYTMPESGKVKLSVLDMLGQEIAVLVDATQGAGSYTVEFSAAGLATGVYIYKITVDGENRDFISTQRMVISH
jgi:hypothetical protein